MTLLARVASRRADRRGGTGRVRTGGPERSKGAATVGLFVKDASQAVRPHVGAIERGERNVSIDNIARIAEALGLQIGELFQRIDGPPV